jgi:hypothetical protein
MFSREPEFSGNGLADAIRKVRGRIMVNRWLQQWITVCNWIFVALILLAAMLPFLRAPLVAGGIAIALAAAVAALRVRYLRPSAYETAQRLDNESRQSDRIATAVYFWSAADPSPMLLRQREDTVDRVAKLDPKSFFPIRMPGKMQWTAGLVAAFGVLCAFHASYGPPLPALKAKLAESRAIEATLAPFSRILGSLESAQGGKTSPSGGTEASKGDSADGRKLPGLQPSLDSMQNGLSGAANAEGAAKGALASSSQNRDVLQSGPSNSSPPNEGIHLQNGSSDSSSQNRTNQGSTPTVSSNKLASLASRAMQALQDLMQDAAVKQSDKSNASSPDGLESASQQYLQEKTDSAPQQGVPGAPESRGGPTQPTQGPPPKDGDGMDVSTTTGHRQLSGAGSATQAWQPQQANRDKLTLPSMTEEHVPLESNGFKGAPGTDRANVGAGTAQVPLQDLAPPAVATVNGAGQDTVPTRYRQYVRDYFKLGKN